MMRGMVMCEALFERLLRAPCRISEASGSLGESSSPPSSTAAIAAAAAGIADADADEDDDEVEDDVPEVIAPPPMTAAAFAMRDARSVMLIPSLPPPSPNPNPPFAVPLTVLPPFTPKNALLTRVALIEETPTWAEFLRADWCDIELMPTASRSVTPVTPVTDPRPVTATPDAPSTIATDDDAETALGVRVVGPPTSLPAIAPPASLAEASNSLRTMALSLSPEWGVLPERVEEEEGDSNSMWLWACMLELPNPANGEGREKRDPEGETVPGMLRRAMREYTLPSEFPAPRCANPPRVLPLAVDTDEDEEEEDDDDEDEEEEDDDDDDASVELEGSVTLITAELRANFLSIFGVEANKGRLINDSMSLKT